MKKLIVLILCLTSSAYAASQSLAIVGATVHTMGEQGTLNNATVLVQDGKIVAVSDQSPSLSGYQVLDAKGKVVTPGLIGAYTSLGLVEIGFSAGMVDSSSKTMPISNTGVALDVSYAVNPDSTLLPINRRDGFTSAATGMSYTGQLFAGQGAIISLGDKTDPVLKKAAFVAVNVSNGGADAQGGSRASIWVTLLSALDEALYARNVDLSPENDWHGLLSRADVKALIPVVNGEIPLLIDARRAADIRQVIKLGERYPKLKLVLLRATEGWRVAEEIAQAEIPVILDPESNLPYGFDQMGATMQNAARLYRAGVKIAIGFETHNIRLARQHAGNAVSHGLPWQAGLAALTSMPAQIYGMQNSLGRLQEGMQADLVIWSGDPLQVTEAPEKVMVKGQWMSMQSRQSKLRDRYLTHSSQSEDAQKTAPLTRP